MTDPRTLEQLAEIGEPRGADAVWESGQQRLRRRRRVQQVPLVALVVLVAVVGWSTVRSFGPSRVEITSAPPAGPSPGPCPDDEGTTMQQRRLAAVAAAGALLAGCTDNGQATSDSSDGAGAAPSEEFTITVEVAGDLTETTTMSLPYWEVVEITGDDEEAMQAAWTGGDVAPPDLRFENGDGRLKLSWDELDSPSVIAMFEGFSFISDDGDCTTDVTPTEGFVLTGTLDCIGLSGLRPGHDERPTIDLHAEFHFDYVGCVTLGQEPGAPVSCEEA